MSRTVIFCADGTWNSPNQDPDEDLQADPTNVYKLFVNLAGDFSADSLRQADEQEKSLQKDGVPVQVAKYIHGVGDSRNPIIKLLGGAFGAGIISRIVRGYTFLSRNYEPGAALVILGFSRGAYTARALAGLVASQGLLALPLTVDREQAYRSGTQAWYRYRRSALHGFSLAHLAEVASDLPAFLSSGSLQDSDLVPVDRIAAVAVWDTVGALGVPEYIGQGRRLDAFRFVDTVLSSKVGAGIHAVARDEERMDFAPTLWDPAPNVQQVLFPGAHGDAGGGYPECGLSDGALDWMTARLKETGVAFAEVPAAPHAPDPAGVAHRPWQHGPWPLLPHGSRTFPADLLEDPSVQARRNAGPVVPDPGCAPELYT